MAVAPKNPFVFAVFLVIVVILMAVLHEIFGIRLFPKEDKSFYLDIKLSEEELADIQSNRDSMALEPSVEFVDTATVEEDSTSPESEPPMDNTITTPVSDAGTFKARLYEYRDSVLNQLPKGTKRTDIIIRYYPHKPDGRKIYQLSDLGYYLHERPTHPEVSMAPSNSLYYGDNVPLEDIQLVALTMLELGIPLKQITISRFHDDWKANALEIGADEALNGRSLLTAEDISAFRK